MGDPGEPPSLEVSFSSDELPDAWKEDLEGNIIKHQDRIVLLKKQLQKEEKYVGYLEHLLEDAKARKTVPGVAPRSNAGLDDEKPVPSETACAGVAADSSKAEDTPLAPPAASDLKEVPLLAEEGKTGGMLDSSGFITVISVGHRHKTVAQPSAPAAAECLQKLAEAPLDGCDPSIVRYAKSNQFSFAPQRKAPPKPPPKNYRKFQSNTLEPPCAAKSNVIKSQSFDFGRTGVQENMASLEGLVKSNMSTSSASGGETSLVESSLMKDQRRESPVPSIRRAAEERVKHRDNDLDASVDDGYASKDRARAVGERKHRVPLRIVPPTAPVKKSLSKDNIAVEKPTTRDTLVRFASKDSLGKCSSRESLDKFSSRENLGKFASKESLKDSGTSSPRNMSPKFFEAKVSRSASQSSSGSIPTSSALHVSYMEGIEEPLYDTVAAEIGDAGSCQSPNYSADTMKSTSSCDFEEKFGVSDTIRSGTSVASMASATSAVSSESDGADVSSHRPSSDPQTPIEDYVNIDYYLRRRRAVDGSTVDCSNPITDLDDHDPRVRRASAEDLLTDSRISNDSLEPDQTNSDPDLYVGADDSVTSTSPPDEPTSTVSDHEVDHRASTYRRIVDSVLHSEHVYVECLSVMLQYMKALKATITTSQPVISRDDFSSIFFKIPELHSLHSEFLDGLRMATRDWDGLTPIGESFKFLAENLGVYGVYLQNYRHAVETVRRCSAVDAKFAEITRCIKLRTLQGLVLSLEELLHRPVARVQQNAPVLHDLLRYLPPDHPDHRIMSLAHAFTMTQDFITKHNGAASQAPGCDRVNRHVVKNSFVVEMSDNQRKLRHLFLFNDVLVCAKHKVSGRGDKFTFEVKWIIPLGDIEVGEDGAAAVDSLEPSANNLVSLKSQASTVRDQIRAHERYSGLQGIRKTDNRTEKQKKKLMELETQLMLAAPNLPFRVSSRQGRISGLFFFSSDFERDQWTMAVTNLQVNTPPSVRTVPVHFDEVQSWISTYRRDLHTNLGSALMRSDREESLLVGDLHLVIQQLTGLEEEAELYICVEVDSYGNFFRKAQTKCVRAVEPYWNEDFIVELDGSCFLRILCYEVDPRHGHVLRGRVNVELSRSWLKTSMSEHTASMDGLSLSYSVKYASYEMTMRRPPPGKNAGLFGSKIQLVCRREKRSVPFLITSCVREVERRGMQETGVYRVSGSASNINRLKKLFETNIYEAEQLIKEVDIHSVTGLLKLYLRELPEALFTDQLYSRFFDAFTNGSHDFRRCMLLQLFSELPQLNQSVIVYLIEHMIRVHCAESFNKMSLHNLATVFGPTLLRPGPRSETGVQPDLLAAGTVDVMAQAGILYFFLQRRAHGEPIQIGIDATVS